MITFLKLDVPRESASLVNKLLKEGLLAQGKFIENLEREIADLCKSKHAIAVSNGTAALHLALIVLGVKAGDEVITTPFTFGATANAIMMCGATPIFVDIDKDTFAIDPNKIAEKISKKTKAIVAVDIFGRLCNYKEINKIASKHKLKVIEDACQAIGAEENGKMAGSFGDIGVFSLYATKNLFSGEGGVVVTENTDLAKRLKILRNHGQDGKTRYNYIEWGYNYRMTDIEAAIALPQFKTLSKNNALRINNAKFYNKSLQNLDSLSLPETRNKTSVFHLYTIRVAPQKTISRNSLQRKLSERGIQTGIYYPKPLHLYKPYLSLGYQKGDYPVAETACKEVLSLPICPRIKKSELKKIVKAIKIIYKN